MAIEVVAVEGLQDESANLTEVSQETPVSQETSEVSQERPPARRGRPPGAKDKAPRKRVRNLPEEEEEEEPLPPRPVTRRSSVGPPRPVTRRSSVGPRVGRRVQIAEEEEEESEEEPPSPRTRRHQEWTAYRKHRADAHQANVNHYARMFDRMLV